MAEFIYGRQTPVAYNKWYSVVYMHESASQEDATVPYAGFIPTCVVHVCIQIVSVNRIAPRF